jgi:L-iditol 2-dehydrogenase
VRAALVHGPNDLRIEDVPDPDPGPGEVVLRIAAAASCHTDVKSVRHGHPSLGHYPARLGHEFAGVVEHAAGGFEAGEEVFCANSAPCLACRPCRRGRESLCEDLLYLTGGFAERILVPERIVRTNLHRLPAGLPLALAPLAEPLACVVHALDLDVPERVTILGAGSLGCMLAALLDDPLVLDPHPERLVLAERFGARTALATRSEADIEVGRAELVIEAVGRPEAWELAVAMADPGGTVSLFGGCARGTTFTVPTARVHYDEVTLLGTYHHAPRYIAEALRILAAREHPWEALLGPRITLEQLPDALAGRLHRPAPPKYHLTGQTPSPQVDGV